jgi:protein arginine kinase activator
MIICEVCKKKQATVHLTNIEDNIKKEVHMCEECAQKKGFSVKTTIQLSQAVGQLAKLQSQEAAEEEQDLQCEACGMTWGDFRSGGRFGCANDYVVFRSKLAALFRDIHAGEAQHVGKAPQGKHLDVQHRREVLACRRKLREAVEREAYEEAAELRDRLGQLEAEDGETSPPPDTEA